MTARRRLLWLALLAGLVVVATAGYLLWPRGPQGALRVTPNPIDFGVVPWLETRTTTVEVRNVSDREILLKTLRFDCSCFATTRPADSLRLAPGRATTLEVLLYTPKTTAGRFRKLLVIESDDPVTPRLDVPLLGHIIDYRTVTPRELTLGGIDAEGEPISRRIEVRGGEGYAVEVVEATSSDPRLVVEVERAADGSDVVVRTTKGAAKGRLSAELRLTLEVKGPEGTKHRYPDLVRVHGEFR